MPGQDVSLCNYCKCCIMSFRHVGLSFSADGNNENPPDSDETVNGFINKAAHSLVYKSMAVLLSIHLDVDSQDGTWTENPLGNEIGRILKMIGLVLAVTFAISFALIPLTVAVVLCCCQQSPTSGTCSHSYSSLRQTKNGNSGKDNTKRQSRRRASCGKTYQIGVLFGLPAGIIVGIIAGVNTWPYM
ncbi:hypothetical protein GHT06_021400 [Daphnia sinensis]|uniref:Uncharacterized protein n=1 Tax=Daphnia sinensis TaxID=1820382 RepID=A0AAD5L9D5_9CRUS|nr:hypothetical protein GHT06_021400 [Daphnia sinensis]